MVDKHFKKTGFYQTWRGRELKYRYAINRLSKSDFYGAGIDTAARIR